MSSTAEASAVELRCRTCRNLQTQSSNAVVPVAAMLDYHGKSIAEMIFELTDIMVTVDLQLPQFVCLGCVEDLRLAYNFRQRCIDSNELFLQEETADGDGLILKMEPCDMVLPEKENQIDGSGGPPGTTDGSSTKEKATAKAKQKRQGFSENMLKYIKEEALYFHCNIEPVSGCSYAQKNLDINNFIRHCRKRHPEHAKKKGLVPGYPAVEEPEASDVPMSEAPVQAPLPVKEYVSKQDDEEPRERRKRRCVEAQSKHAQIAVNFIKKLEDNRFHCAIDEASGCDYSQTHRQLFYFIRHFRTQHPKASVEHKLHDKANKTPKSYTYFKQVVKPDPPKDAVQPQQPEAPRLLYAKDRKQRKQFNFTRMTSQNVEIRNGKYYCAINKASACRYVQRKYDMGNFLRHFRTLHTLEAISKNMVRRDKPIKIEVKRIIRKHLICIDVPYLVECIIKLLIMHNIPTQIFEWSGFRMLMDPVTAALGTEINKTSVLQYIHRTVKYQNSLVVLEMATRLISIHIDVAILQGRRLLSISSSYEFDCKPICRFLGLIRATDTCSPSDLKAQVLALLAQYNISESQIFLVVLGNAGSSLGTPKSLQKIFADTYIEPQFEYGETDQEESLIEALTTEFQENFEVVRNVLSSVLRVLNEIVPDTDPVIGRIERLLLDLRSTQYADLFAEHNASYPPLWRPLLWVSKFKSINSLIKQKPFFRMLAQRHPEHALDEKDWDFLSEYQQAFAPLYKLCKDLRQDRQHVPFTTFYMRCLLAVKDARGMNNRFSKRISEALGQLLLTLRERPLFQAALYMDSRFQYYKSVLLTLDQQTDGQNYILKILNRIEALKPDSKNNTATVDNLTSVEKKEDDLDDFLTEMFGGPSQKRIKPGVIPLTSIKTPVLEQFNALEVEPRQPADYDVWKSWLERNASHPQLFPVAMMLLTMPTHSICLERTYSASLLAKRTDGLSEQSMDEMLMIRLNRALFEQVIPNMNNWDKPQAAE